MRLTPRTPSLSFAFSAFATATVAALIFAPFSDAKASSSACQVKLLKIAAENLEREFPEKGGAVGEIKDIVYNSNLPGIPRVIFVSRLASDPNEVCIIDVRTTITEEPESGCPDYKFSEVRTTCKLPESAR